MTYAKGKEPGARRCPICGKPSVPDARPFCSRRCADVDLNRWLSGSYAVPETAPGGDLPLPDPEEGE